VSKHVNKQRVGKYVARHRVLFGCIVNALVAMGKPVDSFFHKRYW
jgi:hypothetical protein